jgi:hypothetical protein
MSKQVILKLTIEVFHKAETLKRIEGIVESMSDKGDRD